MPEEAGRLARILVEERLAACVSLVPGVRVGLSMEGAGGVGYGDSDADQDGRGATGGLEVRLDELHSYETPEFLVLNVEAGSHAYLDWLQGSLRKA